MGTKWRKQPRATAIATSIPFILLAFLLAHFIAYILIFLVSDVLIIQGTLLFWPLMILGFFIGAVVRHRAWRRLREADYLVCPVCEYSLHGLGSSGCCPECGEACDVSSVREHWIEMLNTALRREGCIRLSDREMKTYIWVSTPLLALAIALFGSLYVVTDHVTEGFLVAVFTVGPSLLILQVIIGWIMAQRAKPLDHEMRKDEPHTGADAG